MLRKNKKLLFELDLQIFLRELMKSVNTGSTHHKRTVVGNIKHNGISTIITMNRQGYRVFQKNNICVRCGLVGSRVFVTKTNGTLSANLFGETPDNQLVLMTRDHIIPTAHGGKNLLCNLQCMCERCNNLKGSKRE